MGALKRVPALGKDLLEDTPVPRGLWHHRGAPSWGDELLTVQRLYHASSASSTPHRPVLGQPSLASFILESRGLPGSGKCKILCYGQNALRADLGNVSRSSRTRSLRSGGIGAAFDHLALVIDHPIGRMPDTPDLHLFPTVRTPERIAPRTLLIPLPVGQPGDE